MYISFINRIGDFSHSKIVDQCQNNAWGYKVFFNNWDHYSIERPLLVIPITLADYQFVLSHPQYFSGYRCIVPDKTLVQALDHKTSFCDWLSNHGFDAYQPKRYRYPDIEIPCVAKKNIGEFGVTVWMLHTLRDVYSLLEKEGEASLQEMLYQEILYHHKEYTVNLYIKDGFILTGLLFEYTYPLHDDCVIKGGASRKKKSFQTQIKEMDEFTHHHFSLLVSKIPTYHGFINFNYKIMENQQIKIFECNPRIGAGCRDNAMKWFFDLLLPKLFYILSSPLSCIPPHTHYADRTGFAIVEKEQNGSWKVKSHTNSLLIDAVDTRLIRHQDQFFVTYNDTSHKYRMKQREIFITSTSILLTDPLLLWSGYSSHKLDKNATLWNDDQNVVYDFSPEGDLQWITNGQLHSVPFPFLKRLYKEFGKGIVYSIGTPPLSYKGKYLIVGHVKVTFDSLQKLNIHHKMNNPFHGKYQYYMFLMEFDKNEITRLSFNFMPVSSSDSNIPVITFACGLCHIDSMFYISYGENDWKTKIWTVSPGEIESLLDHSMLDRDLPEFVCLETDTLDDLTPQLSLPYKNYFVFNPSMVPWHDNLFILVYRLLYSSNERFIQDNTYYRNPMDIWTHKKKYYQNPCVIKNS